MPWESVASVAVLVAKQFNPTILKQGWLQRHSILAEGDLQDGSIFTDFVVQIRTERFNLLVLQEQLQFIPSVQPPQQQGIILEKLGALIEILPETPYTALGLNFTWQLTAADGNINRLEHELFRRSEHPLFEKFAGSDARFGAYLSKDFEGFRLRLDIKPVTTRIKGSTQNSLRFAFNFHHDLTGDDRASAAIERLRQWDLVRHEAEEIIEAVELRQK